MTTGRSCRDGRLAGVLGGAIGLVLAAALGFGAAAADTVIGPAIQVNQDVVTTYELDQRIKLMTALNQKGDVPKAARESLIDDRLRTAAAAALEIRVANADVQQGMSDFAARGNLTAEQLLVYLAERGVDAESMRDFVRAGQAWRYAVRKRFSGGVTVTDAEIDRAIAAGLAGGTELQVSLAQIFLPDTGDEADQTYLAQRIIDGSKSSNAFMIFAQKYSKGPNAGGGGLLDWQLASALAPEVQGAIAGLEPGEVSKPLRVEGGVSIYYLRDRSPAPATGPLSYDVDFAVMGFAPGQEAAAAAAAGKVISCGALYPVARGLPEEALQRQTLPQRGLPAPYAGVLAQMDPGEIRLVPRSDGGTDLVMLCAKTPQTSVPASRDAVRQQLLNRKIALLAEGWLNQMRSEALIRDF